MSCVSQRQGHRKYVHTAISRGCTTCHAVANVKGATYITLTSPSNQLCFTCHTVSTDTIQHPPYKDGNCVFCHSPHASNFPAHLYASPQDVCMACHVRGLMKVNRKAHTLTLSWGATIPFKEMDSWFYLNLDKTHKLNHPVEGHPVSGPNVALGKDAPPITCLTCHEPHHSTVSNLILPKYKTTTSSLRVLPPFPQLTAVKDVTVDNSARRHSGADERPRTAFERPRACCVKPNRVSLNNQKKAPPDARHRRGSPHQDSPGRFRQPFSDPNGMCSLLNRNVFPQCLASRCGLPAVDRKLRRKEMAGAKEDCDTPLVRARSVRRHGGTWCEAMKKTSNIIFFVRTYCCKLRNILEIRSSIDERPWVDTQVINALSHRSALSSCTLAN